MLVNLFIVLIKETEKRKSIIPVNADCILADLFPDSTGVTRPDKDAKLFDLTEPFPNSTPLIKDE